MTSTELLTLATSSVLIAWPLYLLFALALRFEHATAEHRKLVLQELRRQSAAAEGQGSNMLCAAQLLQRAEGRGDKHGQV